MAARALEFAFQFGPVGVAGTSDIELYGEAIADAKLGHELGFSVGWMIEHHFSDYYPTPNPLVFLSHIAAICPGLGLGTSVMVLPWYNPIRFAEDLMMLQLLSGADLHIGVGRGTAKLEYDAFGLRMEESRERFSESLSIVKRALSGQAITHTGKFFQIDEPVRVRPRLSSKSPQFYGAIGSPDTAVLMADLGLPPMAIAQFPDHFLKKIVTSWREKSRCVGLATNVTMPILAQCWIADTDEEARALARRYLPGFFRLQVDHYQTDADPYKWISGYEQWSRLFQNLRKLSDPTNLDEYMDLNLIGSPDTVAGRINELADIGFNHFLVTNAIAGVPRRLRSQMLTRFATEIAPRFAKHRREQVATTEAHA
jgi:alkanesulfonate monooxygenase SsuD/methylene tetrahydromethanopterin reductase-like flavin-dependent oxidoreductase (luciferase family)